MEAKPYQIKDSEPLVAKEPAAVYQTAALEMPFSNRWNFQAMESNAALSKSLQRALEEENSGFVTKLVNRKNAVAEILG